MMDCLMLILILYVALRDIRGLCGNCLVYRSIQEI